MKKYVSLDKRSKKAQRKYHSERRRTWGDIKPVTRSVPSGKTYNHKKEKRKIDRELRDGFCVDFFIGSSETQRVAGLTEGLYNGNADIYVKRSMT